MKKIIDINNWNRKEYFEFFNQFDEPFFGIVSEIDCTIAYENAKKFNTSFFSYYLYKTVQTINLIDEFRYRIEESNVVCYDKIHISPTVGRKDGSFAFAFVEYIEDFNLFQKMVETEINAIQNSNGLNLTSDAIRNDTIHFSAVPWIKFTGLTHARHFKGQDSVPKICFGKYEINGNKKTIPVSLNAHHGFVDGYHAAKFFDLLQKLMNE